MLMLKLVEIETGCIFHVIHVAGTRMKQSGVDGLYQGDLLEGVMTGQNPLEFFPMNDSADERSGGQVFSWISSWWKYKIEASWG